MRFYSNIRNIHFTFGVLITPGKTEVQRKDFMFPSLDGMRNRDDTWHREVKETSAAVSIRQFTEEEITL